MADNKWIFDISRIVYTTLQYRVAKKYSSANFTTSSINQITKFPTVYFNELQGSEVSSDLEGNEINGINVAYQVEIYSDKSQEVCRNIAKEVVSVMKEMHFKTTTPYFNNESTTYRLVLRFNRTFGSADINNIMEVI